MVDNMKAGNCLSRYGTIEVDGVCPVHGNFRTECLTIGGTPIIPDCPKCEENRLEGERIKEQDREKEARISIIKSMNIEPAYYDASFDNFKATTQELVNNMAKVKALVDGEIKKIVMTGKNGTGKTHLACAALKELGGKIMTMYEISTKIRASYSRNDGETELEIVDGFSRLPLFVIDEIGRTKGGEAEANWLSYIIDKRHVRNLPTILISNKHVRKSCQKSGCPECLENYIGEDIMSRLCENGVLLKFTGDDWRKPGHTE